MKSLITPDTRIKVSSTLDKSTSKKYLTDGNPETCWTSQQGTPQTIQLSFPSPVIPIQIKLTFQGGFVGTRCTIEVASTQGADKANWEVLEQIFPEDVNRQQSFELERKIEGGVASLKLVIEESSDFFGRITVYDLQLEGEIP
ncbi:galactose-binding domain-like protein [Amylocystis lapponica]|nr:galactose-binding domain-like protein [Amylocystis lapponica]